MAAIAHHDLGHAVEERTSLEALLAEHAHDGRMQVAWYYTWCRQPDRAFEWLERAIGQREMDASGTLGDPFLSGLHADPRWPVYLRSLNLPVN